MEEAKLFRQMVNGSRREPTKVKKKKKLLYNLSLSLSGHNYSLYYGK
jgi:hypothetical protein